MDSATLGSDVTLKVAKWSFNIWFQCYVDVGFWGGICGTTTTNVKNIRSLLKSGVAGFQCYLSEPDGVSGSDKPPEPEKRKAPWLQRSMTISSGEVPQTEHVGE